MKRILPIIAIVAALFTMSACSSPKGPEAVAMKAFTAIQKGDFDAYAATFNLSESDQKTLSGMAQEKITESINAKGGIKKFEVADSQVNEDNATVTMHVIYKDGSEDDQQMSFVKVDDQWKQELNK